MKVKELVLEITGIDIEEHARVTGDPALQEAGEREVEVTKIENGIRYKIEDIRYDGRTNIIDIEVLN